jgi:hypothetical protein
VSRFSSHPRPAANTNPSPIRLQSKSIANPPLLLQAASRILACLPPPTGDASPVGAPEPAPSTGDTSLVGAELAALRFGVRYRGHIPCGAARPAAGGPHVTAPPQALGAWGGWRKGPGGLSGRGRAPLRVLPNESRAVHVASAANGLPYGATHW